MKKGIDISEWQSGLNYMTMSKHIDFVILREGYRQSRDKMFQTHVNGFRAAGCKILAVYHFIYATDNQAAKKEAESCIANVKAAGLGKDVMIFSDFEYDTIDDAAEKGVVLDANECNLFTETFCKTIEAAGYKAGIYANEDYVKHYYDKKLLEKYPLWYANYKPEKGNSLTCYLWQYTNKGKVPGYDDDLDMDYLMVEEAENHVSTVEKAISWMENLAEDDSHGYDQIYRWGEKGDYDCSSAVITAWKIAGVPLTCTYTGNMKADMLRHGFVEVKDGSLKRGDVLLNEVHHVAMFCGDGKEVEASINEKGTATGGKPGDQTGREILIRPYRNYPWDCVLRYQSTEERYMFSPETVKKGSKGGSARLLQTLLKGLGYKGIGGLDLAIDGDAGSHTDHAIREYQADHGLAVDGICGVNTWRSIVGL